MSTVAGIELMKLRQIVLFSVAFSLLLGTLGMTADKPEKSAKDAKQTTEKPDQTAPEEDAPENPFPNRLPAPGLEGGKAWLNTSGDITLKDLRGKVVLLDFWTYCCINCMHVLPDLEFLEKKYANQLVVVGVHSAKFDNEKESENISRAIMRYEIEHPVINDANMTVWRKYGVRAWPTVVLIDPEGNYCGYLSGEGNREVLDKVIGTLVDYHRAAKTLDETPIRFDLEKAKVPPTPLRFPGKVLADEAGDRLFISDSNHNRIVIASLDGTLKEIIGSGALGADDGPYADASFDHPQGMALVNDTLYVADTENHLIRAVDLKAKEVVTLAGTGEQARGRGPGGNLRETALSSPWDLVFHKGVLYIAMAGPHQIWALDLAVGAVGPYAGSGREDILNGPLAEAALAQPSGLTTDGEFLYAVDSEGSSVRKISLDPKGDVTTIVGSSDLPQGRCLFEFGDRDGVGDEARLQHPLGLVYHAGELIVADSYNHKIKRVNLKKKSSEAFLGTGEPGAKNEPPQFSEPAGLTIAGETLYIADTNNHLIRTANLKTGKVQTLEIAGLEPPAPIESEAAPVGTEAVKVPNQVVKAGPELTFRIPLQFPEGYKLNKLAPVTFRITSDEEQTLLDPEDLGARDEAKVEDDVAFVSLPLVAQSGKGTYRLSLTYPFCREGTGGLCKLRTVDWMIPVEVSAEAKTGQIPLTIAAEKPEPAGLKE